MKILRSIYKDLERDEKTKQDELVKWQEIRDIAASEGDLRENQDYEEAVKKIKILTSEMLNIKRILYSAEVVDESELIDTLEVGVWVNMKIVFSGKVVSEEEIADEHKKLLHYDASKDKTIFQADVIFGVPLDDYVSELKLSTSSDLFNFLKGRPAGQYKYLTTKGQKVEITIAPREGVV